MGKNNFNNSWKNKDDNRIKAEYHTIKMEKEYKEDIEECVENTFTYDNDSFVNFNLSEKFFNPMEIIVENIDSVSAIYKYAEDGFVNCVLNFASYKNAGGKFLEGSIAQEEALCHESTLYNVLRQKTEYYEWNEKHTKNKSLYLNRALYSEDVLFVKGEEKYCDVLTCACPNKRASQKYNNISDEENFKALKDRIEFMFKVANYNNVDTLILGAWGTGVFGQSTYEVANAFKSVLSKYPRAFNRVVFAIPNSNEKIKIFNKVFVDKR